MQIHTHAIIVERAQQICRNFLGSRSIRRHNNDKNIGKNTLIKDYARIGDLTDNRPDRVFSLVFVADFHGVRIRPIVPTCRVEKSFRRRRVSELQVRLSVERRIRLRFYTVINTSKSAFFSLSFKTGTDGT